MCNRNHRDRRDDNPGFHWAIRIREKIEIKEISRPMLSLCNKNHEDCRDQS